MLSRALLESLIRIRNLNEFTAFKDHLAEQVQQAMKTLAGANDDRMMHKAQGAYQALQALQDLIEGSPELLDKERRAKPGI